MMNKLFVVCSGENQRGVYRRYETALKIVEGLDEVDKYIRCCYEPGYNHVKIMGGE